MSGVKGKSGPATGNLNGMKNGTSLARSRLVIGNLPKKLLSVRREGRAYRRLIESEVLAARGRITATDSHHIDTASAATVHAGICRWLLREKLSEMSTGDILACSKQIVQAKQARDLAIKALGLDAKPEPICLDDYIAGEVDDENKHHQVIMQALLMFPGEGMMTPLLPSPIAKTA